MRTIVRFSLNNDQGSKLRNALFQVLENGGLKWTGATTGTYEGSVSADQIRDTMREFWNTIGSYMGPAGLDHFWMYSDQADSAGNGEDEGS